MADDEETFVPRSDEDLARLLEEQLKMLRRDAAEVTPLAVPPVQDAPIAAQQFQDVSTRDIELDEIFNALLDDEAESQGAVVDAVAVASMVTDGEETPPPVPADEFKAAADEVPLVQTQPIDVVPIPSMFGEGASDEAYIAAALAPEGASEVAPDFVPAVSTVAVTETVIDDLFEDGAVEETIIEEVSVDSEVVEEVVVHHTIAPVSDSTANSLVTSFERRPNFDELVFGVSSED